MTAPIVLVVAYRSDDHLPDCLDSVRGAGRLVVVDNDASAATRDLVVASGGEYLAAEANLGFAAAVNRGLASYWDGKSDVLLLNPDARVTSEDVAALQAALHAPETRIAAVGPTLVGFTGRPQRPAWPMPSPAQVWMDALGLSALWRGRRFVVGAVLLLNGAALAEIGTLDERYFLYAEEADWQLRAQRAGWTVDIVASVVARHIGAASSADAVVRDRLFFASNERFARRWYGSVGWMVMRLGALVAAARRSLIGPRERRRTNRRALALYLRGPVRAGSADGRPA